MNAFSKTLLIFALVSLSWPGIAQIERSILTSSIENREPVDDLANLVTSDGTDNQRVYFFTQVKQLEGDQIIHRWFFGDKEMATVTLNIGSNNWRTYSSKRLLPSWLGDWRIEVWHGDLKMFEHRFEFQ